MRKNFFILAFLCFAIGFNGVVFSAPKRKGRSAGARSVSVKNVSGKISGNNFVGSVKTSSTALSSTAMNCGVVADGTNMQAKRLCAVAMGEALENYCKEYPCQSKVKVEYSFSFALPKLENISVDVNGASCSGVGLETFCSAFSSELLDGLWDLYSEKNIRERKNCNMAMAKYSAAQDCFQYIQSYKNKLGGEGVFNASAISDLDKKIDEICGKDAILAKYKTIAVDELSGDDINLFFNMAQSDSAGNVSVGAEHYTGKKKLSSTVASLFANVGDNTWNLMGQIGKFADLNLTNRKSTSYPRELVVIANTFVTEGEAVCGKSFVADMEDTSFKLVDNRSSLERLIAKKGILKGSFDLVADEEWKEEGIAGMIKKSHSDELYDDKTSKNDKSKLNVDTCSGVDDATDKVKEVLEHISVAVEKLNKAFENANDEKEVLDNNKDAIKNIVEVLQIMLTYKRAYADGTTEDSVKTAEKAIDNINSIDSKNISISNFNDIKEAVENLNIVGKFNCPDDPNNPDSVSGWMKYEFTYGVDDVIYTLEKSRDNFVKQFNNDYLIYDKNKNEVISILDAVKKYYKFVDGDANTDTKLWSDWNKTWEKTGTGN